MPSPDATKARALEALERRMHEADSYEAWLALAREHDRATGADAWRKTETSTSYDYLAVSARERHLRDALEARDAQEVLYALNEGVHGNMAGMGRPVLYARAKCGTKSLIDAYVSTLVDALEFVRFAPDSKIPIAEKLDFFRRASHCYGRSALLLSGGAGLIYFHHGVVHALLEQDLLPNVISGASAGSVVAAQLGTKTDDELRAGYFLEKRYLEPTRTSMVDVMLGRVDARMLKEARERTLDEFAPKDLTFQEAYEKTGRYINISISPAERHQTSRLMNAITSPHVYVRSAVSASSSLPGVMPAERLYAKGLDGKPRPFLTTRRWVDGSFSQDLPAKRLARLYGVNHFVVSLINPVVLPFVDDVKSRRQPGVRAAVAAGTIDVASEALRTIEKRLHVGGPLGSFAASQLAYLVGMLDQEYLGNVNIFPETSDFRFVNALFHFEDGEVERLIDAGRKRTWPKIAMVRNAARVSRTLDRALEELERRNLGVAGESKHRQYV